MIEKKLLDDNPHWVAVYGIIRQGDKILFLRRKNTDYMCGFFGLPSGKVFYAESALDALKREIREETGIIINPENAKLCHISHRFEPETKRASWVDFYFLIEEWQGKIINGEPEKCSEIAWLPITTHEPVVPYLLDVVHNIAQDKFLTLFGKWAEPHQCAD